MLCSYNKNALDDNINKVSTSENIKEENKTIEEEKEQLKNAKARKLKNEIVSREFKRLTDKIVAEYVPQLLEWTKVVTVNAAYDRQRYTK